MVSFIHIADRNEERAIRRNGIKSSKCAEVRGVFAMPVIPNYATTHQWARELKRRGKGRLPVFRIPGGDRVSARTYNGHKLSMTAAEALGTVLTGVAPMGLKAIISRTIKAKEITKPTLRHTSPAEGTFQPPRVSRHPASANSATATRYEPSG